MSDLSPSVKIRGRDSSIAQVIGTQAPPDQDEDAGSDDDHYVTPTNRSLAQGSRAQDANDIPDQSPGKIGRAV